MEIFRENMTGLLRMHLLCNTCIITLTFHLSPIYWYFFHGECYEFQ